ncbi:MAG TPA: hypothetical protein VGE42_01480 [Candidatus Dormibacteraeota bacterium]|jgi:hypothetical protein
MHPLLHHELAHAVHRERIARAAHERRILACRRAARAAASSLTVPAWLLLLDRCAEEPVIETETAL